MFSHLSELRKGSFDQYWLVSEQWLLSYTHGKRDHTFHTFCQSYSSITQNARKFCWLFGQPVLMVIFHLIKIFGRQNYQSSCPSKHSHFRFKQEIKIFSCSKFTQLCSMQKDLVVIYSITLFSALKKKQLYANNCYLSNALTTDIVSNWWFHTARQEKLMLLELQVMGCDS